jgi:Ser/Thr protein kinase RdoA (MazF antagonist)
VSGDLILIHGFGRELIEPDWAPVADHEAQAVLARYGLTGAAEATVAWRSPRPMSAVAIVRCGDADVVLKRHDPRVRTAAALAVEHRLADQLRRGGVPVPAVLTTPAGITAITVAGGVYELHELAAGIDLYRDAPSWTGYRSHTHAHAAGEALAQLHRAAAPFTARSRPFGPLTDSCALAAARDPIAALAKLAARRPGLALGVRDHPWREQLSAALTPFAAGAAAALALLPRSWGHGDWHPSNLTWSADGPEAQVASVLDLGLANRTTPAWDLAIAIERACVEWFALEDSNPARPARADLAALDALLDGYETQRPLTPNERAALPALMPVVHLGFALSEIEYYAAVLRSPERAQVAYRDYLIGHCRWFRTADGTALLTHLRKRTQAPARLGPLSARR